jgi:hypothetical protein
LRTFSLFPFGQEEEDGREEGGEEEDVGREELDGANAVVADGDRDVAALGSNLDAAIADEDDEEKGDKDRGGPDDDDDDDGGEGEGEVEDEVEGEEEENMDWMASVSDEKWTGLVRCSRNPASALRFTSSSIP